MNWRIEREVKSGATLDFEKDDLDVTHEPGETGGVRDKQLDAGRAAANAMLEGVAGKRLVTIEGHDEQGTKTAEHLTVTVSRDLS